MKATHVGFCCTLVRIEHGDQSPRYETRVGIASPFGYLTPAALT